MPHVLPHRYVPPWSDFPISVSCAPSLTILSTTHRRLITLIYAVYSSNLQVCCSGRDCLVFWWSNSLSPRKPATSLLLHSIHDLLQPSVFLTLGPQENGWVHILLIALRLTQIIVLFVGNVSIGSPIWVVAESTMCSRFQKTYLSVCTNYSLRNRVAGLTRAGAAACESR